MPDRYLNGSNLTFVLFFARSVFYKLLFSIERILYCKIDSVSYSHSYFEIHKVFKHAHNTCKCGCKWYVTQIHKINEKKIIK